MAFFVFAKVGKGRLSLKKFEIKIALSVVVCAPVNSFSFAALFGPAPINSPWGARTVKEATKECAYTL